MNELIVKLRDLICQTHTENEFSELIFQKVQEFDWQNTTGAYNVRAFATVMWALRIGHFPKVLWLAQIVAGNRPQHADLQALVAQIAAAVAALAADANQAIREELLSWMKRIDENLPTPVDLARDIRDLLRKHNYGPLDLAHKFHLSEAPIERLTAILALEAAPDATYLRWLSERLVVELPFIAFMAAKAMTTAMLRLSGEPLQRAIAAAGIAKELLDGLQDPQGTISGFGVTARSDQLHLAQRLATTRTRQACLLQPAHVGRFLVELVTKFDRNSFELMCLTAGLPRPKFVGAHPDDPLDLIVIHVFVAAVKGQWVQDLLTAAHKALPNSPVFQELRLNYAVAAAG